MEEEKYKKYLYDKSRCYVKEHLSGKLKLKDSEFTVEPTDKGCHSLIIFLRADNFNPMVIRGVRKKYKLQRILRNTSYLSRLGFNVPRVLYADDSVKTFKEFGHYLLVEEKIQGKSLGELGDLKDTLPLIAENFARLHSISSGSWGMIGSLRQSGFPRYINKKIQHELRHITKSYSSFLSSGEIKDCSKWFRSQQDIIKRCHTFSLCHGDPYLTNIYVAGDNRLYLLDNDHTKYYPAAVEFFKLGFVLNQDDNDSMAEWRSLYLSGLSEELREEFQASKNFYLAYVLLHIISGLLEDDWRRENPYTFSPGYAKNLLEKTFQSRIT